MNHSKDLERWNRWNADSAPNYPQEKVIQFCLRSFPTREERAATHALDWGCGSGVNTAFMCAEGFRVTATDFSSVAIDTTRRRLEREELSATLLEEDLTELSLDRSSVDLVVSIGVLDSAGFATSSAALRRLPEVLRPGSRGIFLFAEAGDWRVQAGDGLHGYTREEVERLFYGFREVFVDQYITTYRGGRQRECDWLITIGS